MTTSTGSRRLRIVIAALVALIVLSGATALLVRAQLEPGAPVADITDVAVRDDEFAPAAIAVPAGTTVTWRWLGEDEHNVAGDGFESPVQTAGEFAHTFATPGTFDYECTLHLFMRGRVVVTD